MALRRVVGPGVIELACGDIVHETTDAIVNAANHTLLGGGGVDGAIHRAGGPAILAECRTLGGCATGDARVTGAGRLAARIVIHAVGPVYRGGGFDEDRLLGSAYRRALELAEEHGVRSIAFPSISTGAYGFPVERAARIALGAVVDALSVPPRTLQLVRFVLFSEADREVYGRALEHL